jgi:hypothetical protein
MEEQWPDQDHYGPGNFIQDVLTLLIVLAVLSPLLAALGPV